jgi:DNA-binding response OmpR family regulator
MKKDKNNILVVDDDERTLRMMEAMLTPQGFKVMTARNGKEAVDITGKKKPDLVLMDMMMPVMDGLTACLEIKNNNATGQTPVVMLTAVSSDGNKMLARDIWKADGYITKPVDLVELRNAIDRFL